MLRPGPVRRFRPEALFRPRSVVLVGATTPLGRAIAANLARFQGTVITIEPGEPAPQPPADLAILACAPHQVAQALMDVAAAGTFAAVCATPAPDLARAAQAAGVVVLGPSSFGLVVPALGLDASTAHLRAQPGKVALISQSAALCRAVLDWAGPNGVGFSTIAGTGGNASRGFSLALDWLSRDPGTGAIMLDIRTIRNRRAFLAAARAAARLRPVVAIRAGGRLADPSGRGDLVFDAALRRAGVLRVSGLAELLGAAEILTRARPPRGERLAIVTNAIGPAHMAADAAVAHGLPLLQPDAHVRTVLRLHLPDGPDDPGVIWTGADRPTRVAEAAAMLSGVAETGGIVAILAPTGPADAAAIVALVAGRNSLRVPLLACVLGETTGAAHRRTLSEAGVPAFATPEAAVGAFALLVQQRRARAAAAELPSRRVLQLAPDHAVVAHVVAAARAAGRERLLPGESHAVLAAYGIALAPGAAPALRIGVIDDTMFGPAICLGFAGPTNAVRDMAFELPPLNLALAHALIARTPASLLLDDPGRGSVADALVRISQLVIDQPEIATIDLDLADTGTAAIELHLPGEHASLAITPYPADLAQPFDACGEPLLIRPIRPEDAEAHAAFFGRLTPEDVRYRFFNLIRELQPEQIARMTQVDYDREMAFVAIRGNETVGVCRLVRVAGTAGGEFAVVVEPAMKGRGLARALMQHILDWGRSQGMSSVTGQVLAENAPMLAFMRRIGATIHRMPDEPDVVEAVITL